MHRDANKFDKKYFIEFEQIIFYKMCPLLWMKFLLLPFGS